MRKTNCMVFAVLGATVLAGNVFAKPAWCNYTDYFHLSKDTPPTVIIRNLTSDNNVIAQLKDAVSFYLKDAPSCPPEGGIAKVTYGFDTQHYCDLTIHDGENEYHPQVTASCNGLSYAGITYDGIGSYSYSLHFSLIK